MKKIIDHLKENWIRHGFETLVVTVGILGAFTLNNWNENRKQRIIEKQFLYQLVDELKSDLESAKQYASWHTSIGHSGEIVARSLEEDLPFSDSLYQHFKHMVNPFLYNYNTSIYENLKSSGFSIISNSTLRQKIQKIYAQFEQHKHGMELLTQEYLITMNVQQQQHLIVDPGSSHNGRPRDYELLKKNFVFINTLNDMWSLHREVGLLFEDLVTSIEELIVAIEEEIERLES